MALNFKQSCANFRPQNGQTEVPNFQIPNLEILDSKSPDFMNSNSWIHRSHKRERSLYDTDLRFQFMDGFLYYQGLFYIPDGPC
jgi:hypothetical protein